MTQALDIGAETQALLLQILIADFAHELSHKRVLVTQVDDFHFFYLMIMWLNTLLIVAWHCHDPA